MSTQTGGRPGVSALAGRVILVTGARRGIGLAVAHAAAAAGARVIVHARERPQAEAAAQAVGTATRAVWGNLEHVEEIRRVAREAGEHDGRLDGLVNNAGLAIVKPAADLQEAEWDRMFAVNVKAPFFMCQAARPFLQRSTDARVVNIASLHATTAIPGRVAYAASKAALAHLTRTLAIEWAPLGIRVNAVAPGFVRTEQIAHLIAREGPRLEARTPLGRLAEPTDVAQAVLFLLCDASRHITGDMLSVDGGWALYGGWALPGEAVGNRLT
ncbi:MAG: SDR family oxidoreductase [Armatimonadota bacterium]|nr:SDR family oxidoreductase [Armatimonadota bacterium]